VKILGICTTRKQGIGINWHVCLNRAASYQDYFNPPNEARFRVGGIDCVLVPLTRLRVT
jgi:hypothetical protein